MSYTQSVVMVVTAAQRETVIELGRALGWEAGFSAALSADGQEPATHYGLHAWARPEFVALVQSPGLSAEGWTAEQIATARGGLTVSAQDNAVPLEHFESVLAAEGLQRLGDE